MSDSTVREQDTGISSDQALRIARLDAENAYRDLSIYRIGVSLEEEGWRIDYVLKDDDLQGGGPRYLIDARTGEILWKRYAQ